MYLCILAKTQWLAENCFLYRDFKQKQALIETQRWKDKSRMYVCAANNKQLNYTPAEQRQERMRMRIVELAHKTISKVNSICWHLNHFNLSNNKIQYTKYRIQNANVLFAQQNAARSVTCNKTAKAATTAGANIFNNNKM